MILEKPSLEYVKMEQEEDIAIVRVDRPKALNALNRTVLEELKKIFIYIESCSVRLKAKEPISTVIFTGTGDKSFIAGADILEMKGMSNKEAESFAHLGQEVTKQIELLSQPVIAAVNGFALGGGCELAMACDFILASENAIFGQPETNLGLLPGFGGCVRLPRYVGLARAKELIFTGRKFSATEAREMGLVLEVVKKEELISRAKSMAKDIRKSSPLAVATSKRTIRQIYAKETDIALKEEAAFFAAIFGTHDQIEGTTAFTEKRKPNFLGE